MRPNNKDFYLRVSNGVHNNISISAYKDVYEEFAGSMVADIADGSIGDNEKCSIECNDLACPDASSCAECFTSFGFDGNMHYGRGHTVAAIAIASNGIVKQVLKQYHSYMMKYTTPLTVIERQRDV